MISPSEDIEVEGFWDAECSINPSSLASFSLIIDLQSVKL